MMGVMPTTLFDITISLRVRCEYAGDGDYDCDSIDSLAAELGERWEVTVDHVDTWIEEVYLTVASEAEVREVQAVVAEYRYIGEVEVVVGS
jgi:hypothetical protein